MNNWEVFTEFLLKKEVFVMYIMYKSIYKSKAEIVMKQ